MAGNKNSGNRTGLPRAPGAGRKPKSAREHWLTGDAGKRGLALVERPADAGVTRATRVACPAASAAMPVPAIGGAGQVPAELTAAERVFWERWAPLAKVNGTLTDNTTAGFIVLCRTAADAEDCRAEMQTRGIVTLKTELRAHPLWPHYRGLQARLELSLARFGLTSIGRAIVDKDAEEDAERTELRRLLAIR